MGPLPVVQIAFAFATSSAFVIAGTVAVLVDLVLLLPQPAAPRLAISNPATATRRNRAGRGDCLRVIVDSRRDSLLIGSP
jgi:hypothetical protein